MSGFRYPEEHNNLQGTIPIFDDNHYFQDNVIKLNKDNPYGFTHSIYDFREEEYFCISVWRLGNNEDGILVADGIDDDKFYMTQNKPVRINSGGWQQIILEIHIPPQHHFRELRIYTWNNGESDIYFKDLKIERYPQKNYPEFEQTSLEINIDSFAIKKLKAIRDRAFKNGLLETGENDYVKARLVYGKDTLKAKIRLKGDWLDHLTGSKWSFRIKMRKNDAWKNMRSFSVQSPETRGFLDEWFTHRIFAAEDVLTTRYGFVPVKLNGKSLGIYAYEEHFDKQLIESNKRREGPVLKFSEEIFWTVQRLFITKKESYHLPYTKGSDILPFKKSRTQKNKILFNDFLIAQNLLYQYENDLKPLNDIFDIESYAKYYALTDITGAYHGLAWHNFRYYYNPVISRLEPVAFDCYTSSGVNIESNNTILESAQKSKIVTKFDNMILMPFKYDDFLNDYLYYLTKYSQTSYLNSVYMSLKPEIDSLEILIKKEFGYYHFNISSYKDNSQKIYNKLNSFKKLIGKSVYAGHKIRKTIVEKNLSDELIPYFIKIYKGRNENDSRLYLTSYYPEDLTLTGYVYANSTVICRKGCNTIPGSSENYPLKNCGSDSVKYVLIKVSGRDTLFSIPVFKWNKPFNYAPYQELSDRCKLNYQKIFIRDKNNLIIEGRLKIDKTIIIPAGYKVIIKSGTELNFTNKSSFISYSPVNIGGTEEHPVKITSSDGTAMGFNIFLARGKSTLNNVIFDQFNTLDYKGWKLTGAVNFYESDVVMNHVTFENNRCEDALNIIKSDFSIINCAFDNIFSDAFDSDFSEGKITNTHFRDIANDAVDFSGSKVLVSDCEINNAGDKGISCGERSEITVEHVSINKTNIAVASKDLSSLTISNSLITNSEYSFVAFRKKPEYGEAEIYSINNSLNNITNGPVIEKGSMLYIEENQICGTDTKVAERFYIK